MEKRRTGGGLRVSTDGVDRVSIGRRIAAVDGVVVHVGVVSAQGRWALRCLVDTQRRRAFLFQSKCFELPHISEAISYADQTAASFRSGLIGPVIAKVPEPQSLVVLIVVERIQMFRIVVDRTGAGCSASCAVAGAAVGHLRHKHLYPMTSPPCKVLRSPVCNFFFLLRTPRYETTANMGVVVQVFYLICSRCHWRSVVMFKLHSWIVSWWSFDVVFRTID